MILPPSSSLLFPPLSWFGPGWGLTATRSMREAGFETRKKPLNWALLLKMMSAEQQCNSANWFCSAAWSKKIVGICKDLLQTMDKSVRIYQSKISFTWKYRAALIFVLLCKLDTNSTELHVLKIFLFTFWLDWHLIITVSVMVLPPFNVICENPVLCRLLWAAVLNGITET